MTNNTIFLVRNILPSSYGGAESYQLELAQILQKNNYIPIIITSSEKLLKIAKQKKIKTIKAPYIKNQNWSSWRNLLLPVYYAWQLRLYFWYKKQIKKYRPIAIDIQSRDDWIAATIAGKKTNTTVLWTDHIDFRTWVLQNVNQKFKNPIGKKILKLAKIPKKIIMISNFEAKSFKKTILPRNLDNIEIIKNGVVDQKINTTFKSKSFCYVGRLVEYKGINELIEAFNIVSAEDRDVTLDIYGDGENSKKYQSLANNNPRIIFHGYTEKPLHAIAGSEIFILPSYYEGLSISLIQAAMLGKAIIATDIDGNPEVVENNKTGLLVPAKNPQALAEAMLKLIQNPTLAKRLAQNARKKYEQEFNFQRTIEKNFIPLIKTK